MLQAVDPLKQTVKLQHSILYSHIYRRHPELKGKVAEIEKTIIEPDFIAKSKKDGRRVIQLYGREKPLHRV